jgi:hypothetical protein
MLVNMLPMATMLNTYMILEENSQDKSSKPYYRTVTSEMCALQPKNPQSNAMCKRMHQMVRNILRILLQGEPPQDMASAKDEYNLISINQVIYVNIVYIRIATSRIHQ